MTTAKKQFEKEILPKVMQELNIKNKMAAPRVKAIHINVGIGTRLKHSKDFSDIERNIAMISGQKPVVQKSTKAISNFKLRIGMPNGIRVTLRGERMFDFLYKLVNITLPRVRDFRGISPKAFDGQGNYSLGLKDCSVFPEINPDDVEHIHGVQITIVTTAKDNETARKLLTALNFPFRK